MPKRILMSLEISKKFFARLMNLIGLGEITEDVQKKLGESLGKNAHISN
jgi:hypothetical protein